MNLPHPLPALYWRWKQRSLDIRSWEDLSTDLPLEGARVAIVGNAGYLGDLDQGEFIDGHDLVLRMNNFRVRGFERSVGRRVDVYMSNFYVPDVDFRNPDLADARWIVSSRPNVFTKPRTHNLDLRYGEHLTQGLLAMGARSAYVPGLAYVQQAAERLLECPTTGLMAILLATDVLLRSCRSVYVTGFSFFEGKAHYFREGGTQAFEHHNLATEKTVCAKRLLPFVETGRATCDATVARHLGFAASAVGP